LPRLHAQRIARAKADVAGTPGAFVLAADTVVGVGRRILPKAETETQARACLALLSGRRHHVFTAVVVQAPDGRRAERVSDTSVIFTRLTQAQIDAYVASGEWQGKAGGYAIQGRAEALVNEISGSYSNVVGLPLALTVALLKGAGHG
jgi:septum formation protein